LRHVFGLKRAMPRAGALTLSDIEATFLWIAYEPCGRRGRCRVSRLIAAHGDEALPARLDKLTGCAKQGQASFFDRGQARYVTEART
jgi:hypothetical protein